MRLLFYGLFFVVMCGATGSGNTKITEKHKSPQEKRTDNNKSRVENIKLISSLEKNEAGSKREPHHSTRHVKSGLRKSGRRLRPPFLKNDENIRIFERKRSSEVPHSPFYVMKNPEHVGDRARLRLDFVRPGVNGSCPNFRGTAEVVAGQWRLPPDVPVVVATGGDNKEWGHDFEPLEFTAGSDEQKATIKPTKKPGFFKGIEEFFKHSFHMDKTTTAVHTTTVKLASNTPEVTQSSVLQPPFFLARDQPPRGHEETGKDRATAFLKTKQPSRGRDATFNLRIKAVAIPQFPGIRGTGS